MDKPLKEKLEDLRKRIRKLDSALIAFSGGVDSTFLTRICREELGEKAIAVTTQSQSYPRSELIMAKRIAKIIGVKHVIYDPAADEHSHKGPACNSANVYSSLKCLAMRMRVKSVLDASHIDDQGERRKRFIAARSAGVKSPLLESQLTKAEIRVLAKELGLPNWDKPASGYCRVPKEREGRLGKALLAKQALDSLGAKSACVRMSGKKIIIMAGSREMGVLVRKFDLMHRKLRAIGFTEILLRPVS